jgi:DNA-binding PadR family transcriptional regulator
MQEDIRLTPTSYIVLGLLSEVDGATPYELKRMVDETVGHFWSLPRSQLYAEPARLAGAGLLAENREQDGRRRKRYSITDEGRGAFTRWLGTPTRRLTELRDLAFLKLYFGAEPTTLAVVQLEALRALLDNFEAMLAGPDDARAGARQTLEAGIDHVKASIDSWERIARESNKPAAPRSARARRRP